MSGSTVVESASATSPSPRETTAWQSLVHRSIAAWASIEPVSPDDTDTRVDALAAELLKRYTSLHDFLRQAGHPMMFWFFQLRRAFELQDRFRKWSALNLNNYILLPAVSGFVLRRDCFFVSHFWATRADPDPGGATLRLHQRELAPQTWKFIWVDWTCLPQAPRSDAETAYFEKGLQTMSAIIRNCGFSYFYPPFEPRLWILYEIAEFVLTCDMNGFYQAPDFLKFRRHVDEMVATSVKKVLRKRKYRCACEADAQFLTSWLELLVLFRRLRVDVGSVRSIMDNVTWAPATSMYVYGGGDVYLEKFKGTLTMGEDVYRFTPFPQWTGSVYSALHYSFDRMGFCSEESLYSLFWDRKWYG